MFGGGDCINAMKCYCCLRKCQSERDILSVAVELTSEVLHPEACHQHMSLMLRLVVFLFLGIVNTGYQTFNGQITENESYYKHIFHKIRTKPSELPQRSSLVSAVDVKAWRRCGTATWIYIQKNPCIISQRFNEVHPNNTNQGRGREIEIVACRLY